MNNNPAALEGVELATSSKVVIHDTTYLSSQACATPPHPVALLVLNSPQASVAVGAFPPVLGRLWSLSSYVVLADGAANVVWRASGGLETPPLPDAIVGDLDSIEPSVSDFYSQRGVPVIRVDCQDTTDLQKCLEHLRSLPKQQLPSESTPAVAPSSFQTTYVYGSLSGRVDQSFAILNALVECSALSASGHVVLIDESNMSFVLPPTGSLHGREPLSRCHLIRPPRAALMASSAAVASTADTAGEGGRPAAAPPPTLYCGVVPIVGASPLVTTSGLKWDLDRQTVGFGGGTNVCSTSNEIVGDKVEIDNPEVAVLWTCELI